MCLHEAKKAVPHLPVVALSLVLAILLVILCAVSFIPPFVQAQATNAAKFHVDSQRLQSTLEKLSEFGRNPEGGVTRIGFSETDLAAREYVSGLMKQAGLQVRVDPAGNLSAVARALRACQLCSSVRTLTRCCTAETSMATWEAWARSK